MNESDIRLSKTLSYYLRHAKGKGDQSISIDNEGFVLVDSLLAIPRMTRYTFADIERVVKTNDKQRFALINRPKIENPDQYGWYIRANQGHTFAVPNLALKEITLENVCDFNNEAVHASFSINWASIKNQGLSRMNREYIHFSPKMLNAEERRRISGKLRNSDLFIRIDMKNALENGYRFYLSENNVILCPGNDSGILEPKYFTKVLSGYDDNHMKELDV